MATEVHSESTVSDAPRATQPTISRPTAQRSSAHRSSGWTRGLMAVAGIVVLGAAAALMFGAASPAESGPKLTHTIDRRDLEVTVTEQGTLESANNTEVRCKVKGADNTIVWIVENGTQVKQGDLLVRIDTSTIETAINTQEIAYQNALATFAQSRSDMAVAEINITEYVEGTYRSELKTKEKDVAIAKANLRSAQNMLNHAKEMYRKGFMSKLELEGNEYSLQQAELELEVKETDVDVLTRYTRAKQVQDLKGILEAKKAKLASDKAALDLEKAKLDREKEQLKNCVIRAEGSGMVIYDEAEEWEDRPEIREGATVREDQVLLLIPDLGDMQVKVGVHEALIGQVQPGLRAQVELQDTKYDGEVLSIATMAERAGWWNGNVVKYDATIRLVAQSGLKPGMTASVEIFLARHKNVLTIPVAAVVEQEGQFFCWVMSGSGAQKRELELGASDDQFLVVHHGVTEGDEVVINPIASIEEAQADVLKPFSGMKSKQKMENDEDDSESDNSESDNSESDNSESDNSESDNSESDNSESDNSESDNSESDNSESDNSESDNSESDNSESDNSESDNSESDNSESDNSDSESEADKSGSAAESAESQA